MENCCAQIKQSILVDLIMIISGGSETVRSKKIKSAANTAASLHS